jgi:hypothetical protein
MRGLRDVDMDRFLLRLRQRCGESLTADIERMAETLEDKRRAQIAAGLATGRVRETVQASLARLAVTLEQVRGVEPGNLSVLRGIRREVAREYEQARTCPQLNRRRADRFRWHPFVRRRNTD